MHENVCLGLPCSKLSLSKFLRRFSGFSHQTHGHWAPVTSYAWLKWTNQGFGSKLPSASRWKMNHEGEMINSDRCLFGRNYTTPSLSYVRKGLWKTKANASTVVGANKQKKKKKRRRIPSLSSVNTMGLTCVKCPVCVCSCICNPSPWKHNKDTQALMIRLLNASPVIVCKRHNFPND